MPFGLTNSHSTFESLMNEFFRPYLKRFILMLFYDILVYSKNEQEHLEYLKSDPGDSDAAPTLCD